MFGYSLYDDCIYDESFRRRRRLESAAAAVSDGNGQVAPWRGGLNDYACPGDAMTVWLNRSDVREALHIQPNNRFNSADNGVGMNYTLTEPNVLPIWEHARQMKGFKALACEPVFPVRYTRCKYMACLTQETAARQWRHRPWHQQHDHAG
jgi:hypothetical protein